MNVRVRFAPSPTGALHIGSARTALLNYLFARRHGGSYLLRIEDTDKVRSTPQSVQGIHDALDWLGLLPDEPVVMQSTRAERHAEVAMTMLARGEAYRAWDTPEELARMRAEAEAAHLPFRYDGSRWQNGQSVSSVEPVIRLKARTDRSSEIADLVQGTVRVDGHTLDDMVLLRADGTPTYLLSVVVDDHDMGITHVIRGDDHLTNTFRQLGIYHAMGWEPPHTAHVPLVHGPDGQKLSKRHGAVSVMEYRDKGYLPWALCNALLRMGWSHRDQEVFLRREAETLFDLEGMGRAAARLDLAKMLHLNAEHLRRHDTHELAGMIMDNLAEKGVVIPPDSRERLVEVMPSLTVRSRTVLELADNARCLFEKATATVVLDEHEASMVKTLMQGLTDVDWNQEALAQLVSETATGLGVNMRSFAGTVRLALTGGKVSPPLDVVLYFLGREEACARLLQSAPQAHITGTNPMEGTR